MRDSDGWPGLAPIDPAAGAAPATRQALRALLTRIDGWGRLAWRELMGAWRLAHGCLICESREGGVDDEERVSMVLAVGRHGLPTDPEDAVAVADWVLRRACQRLLRRPAIDATAIRPADAVRATTACWLTPDGALRLRLLVRLPMAGMCCDATRLWRFVRALEAFAATLERRRPHPELGRHCASVRLSRALRAALAAHGLVAFLGDGARLARARSGGPAPGCRPLKAPRAGSATIDLGALGRHRGLGIHRGVTVIAGAPYHGKSTLLAAIRDGREDHPPGDGRERVVADPSALAVLAEEGRRIKRQDLSGFFRHLPHADSRRFSTERASGSTSMAASVAQGIAGGCRLLLIDEDASAANFLAIDPAMRRLLGRAIDGHLGLVDALRSIARTASVVLVAGASSASLAAADQVLLMERFEPRDITRRVAALARAGRIPRPRHAQVAFAARAFADDPDCLLGYRHFLAVLADEPERPLLRSDPLGARQAGWTEAIDLRSSGWQLDPALARGACAGAAWACRLADRGTDLAELGHRFAAFIAARGVCALDPFHTQYMSLPPWQLVLAVLERLARPRLEGSPAARDG